PAAKPEYDRSHLCRVGLRLGVHPQELTDPGGILAGSDEGRELVEQGSSRVTGEKPGRSVQYFDQFQSRGASDRGENGRSRPAVGRAPYGNLSKCPDPIEVTDGRPFHQAE